MREIGILRSSAKRHTSRVNQCLILAAGNGSRLIAASGGSPKPLVQLHGKSLLEHVILGAHEAGIDNFVIVVGYGAPAMRQWLAERWRIHYNTVRPHSSLGYKPPAPEAWLTATSKGHGEVETATRFPLLHTPDGGYLNSEINALH